MHLAEAFRGIASAWRFATVAAKNTANGPHPSARKEYATTVLHSGCLIPLLALYLVEGCVLGLGVNSPLNNVIPALSTFAVYATRHLSA